MSGGPDPSVRELRDGELDAVVAIHREAFPDYQSTQLGPSFCRRLLQAYVADPSTVVLVATSDDGSAVGYLVGAPPSVQREVNDRLLGWAVLASIGAAARSPSAALAKVPAAARRARRAAGAVLARLPGRNPRSPGDAPAVAAAALPPVADVRVVLVAVAGSARGTGRGDDLLAGFARWASGRDHRWADLSVIATNSAACRAYERNGWVAGGLEGEGSTQRYWLDLAG